MSRAEQRKESIQADILIEVGGGERAVTVGNGISQLVKKIGGGAQKTLLSFFVSGGGGGGVVSASYIYGGVDTGSETKKRRRFLFYL